MTAILRVSPEEIYPRVKSDASLLVCAYESEETFRSMHLEGAVSLKDFRGRVGQLPKDREIVFYCA